MVKFFQFILVILLFQDLLQVHIPLVSYLDELTCIGSLFLCVIILLNKKVKIRLSMYEIIAINILVIYLFMGIASNLIFNIVEFKYSMLSILMTIKGYIIFFTFRIIFQAYNVKIEMFKIIVEILKKSLYLICIIGIVNIPGNFLMSRGIRFGINTVAIGFSHPTELAFFSIISMTIILFYYSYTNNKKSNFDIILACSIIVFLSGRSKAIGFIIIYIVLFYFVSIMKKFKVKYALPLIPILIYIGLPRINSELNEGARGYLYRGGFKIAKDYFPLGSGFGTFGSYISRLHYSPLYYEYGISNIWGLSPSMPEFIADTYWAMIIGENGFIGIVLIGMLLLLIFIQFIKLDIDYKSKIIINGMILYTFISSIAEPIYSSNKCAALFILLALIITIIRKDKEIKSEVVNC